MTDVTLRLTGEDAGTTELLQKVSQSLDKLTESQKKTNDEQEKNKSILGKAAEGLGEISKNYMNVKAIMGDVQQVLQATVGDWLDSAQAIRSLSLYTQAGVEETSKMVEVFDDAGVGIDQVRMAMKALKSQGLEPNVDTVAKLSDEYRALKDPLQKSEFLTKNFGVRGQELGKIFDMTGDEIRSAADEAEKMGLVFDDEDIKNAETMRKEIDNFNDSIEGVKREVVGALVPGWNAWFNNIKMVTDALAENQEKAAFLEKLEDPLANAAQVADTVSASYTAMAKAQEEADAAGIELLKTTVTYTESSTLQYDAITMVNQGIADQAQAARDAAQANTEMFDSINTGLDNTTQKWLDDLEWFQNGGLELQKQFEDIKAAWSENPDDPDIKRQMEDLHAKTVALKVLLGEIDATTAAQNISDTLGISLEDAKTKLDQMKAELAQGGTMNIDVYYNDVNRPPSTNNSTTNNPNRPKNEAEGGVFTTNSPTLFRTSEYGQRETAIFIPDGKTAADVGAGGLLGGNTTINIYGAPGQSEAAIAREVELVLDRRSRMARNGMAYGGR